MQIKNSVFLVTGGASGLGAASARMAAENGAKVVIADLQAEAGEKLAKELGGRFVKCDVSSEADGKAAVAAALKEFGGLQVLVNCAGIALAERTLGKEAPHDLGRFQKVIQVNVIGTFNMTRLAADAMAKASPNAGGERGVIVNTASVAAFDGQIGQAAYSHHSAGHFRDAAAGRAAEGSAGLAGQAGAFPLAPRPPGGVRADGESHHRDRNAERGDDSPRRGDPHGPEIIVVCP
jgi:NAD(P)-dependent dehydrogenase (short-subunit alcohol dehydrogenase family)